MFEVPYLPKNNNIFDLCNKFEIDFSSAHSKNHPTNLNAFSGLETDLFRLISARFHLIVFKAKLGPTLKGLSINYITQLGGGGWGKWEGGGQTTARGQKSAPQDIFTCPLNFFEINFVLYC